MEIQSKPSSSRRKYKFQCVGVVSFSVYLGFLLAHLSSSFCFWKECYFKFYGMVS